MEFEWTNGRTLSQITVNPEDENGTADVYSYTYDESGIRSSKTVNGVTTYFTTKDGVIQSQTDGTNTMYFQYDNSGNPTGFLYNGTQYFYLTNQMGDVIGITDNTGSLIATYTYDAWGEVLATTPATAGSSTQLAIANANPLRYRGYYLDQETGYYYLQSRYYSSTLLRFINADIVQPDMIDNSYYAINVFCYCDNCPTVYCDEIGMAISVALAGASAEVLAYVLGLLGISVSVLTTANNKALKKTISEVFYEFGYTVNTAKSKLKQLTKTVSNRVGTHVKKSYKTAKSANKALNEATTEAVALSASQALILEKMRKKKWAIYWAAQLNTLQNNPKVKYVSITSIISLNEATTRVKKNNKSVFCRSLKDANTLKSRIGGKFDHHTYNTKEGFFKHYHPRNKSPHIWYWG